MVKREKSIKKHCQVVFKLEGEKCSVGQLGNAGMIINSNFLTGASSVWLQRAILQINGLHNLEIRLMINDANWLGQFHDASAGNVKDVQKTPTGSEVQWGLTLV